MVTTIIQMKVITIALQTVYLIHSEKIGLRIRNAESSTMLVPRLVLATGLGNLPAVHVQTGETVWFGSRPLQNHDPQRLGGPNLDPYPSTRGYCLVWLDPLVPISGSVFRVFQFMVAFRSLSANRKIFTFAGDCAFRMNRSPSSLQTRDTRSMPHPEHDSHRRVQDFWSCFTSNLGGDWM